MLIAKYWELREFALELPLIDRVSLPLICAAVLFASLGLGEAVYRILFLEFEGATDRLPIEIFFGMMLGLGAARLVFRMLRWCANTHAQIEGIRERNQRIRAAVSSIAVLSIPAHQQAIRVIREEVDGIESTVGSILPTMEDVS